VSILPHHLPFASIYSILAPSNHSLHLPASSAGPDHFPSAFWLSTKNVLSPFSNFNFDLLRILE
jgi:hypothetical protein